MKRLFVLLAGFVLPIAGSELFAQITIRSEDIASQSDVLITSYEWDANDNVSGSPMPDTAGLAAITTGADADFTSIVKELKQNATLLLETLPADVPAVDSFANATHVETFSVKVDGEGNDSTFYRFMKLDQSSYTSLGGVLLFDINQDTRPDTLVARYQPDGWQIRELPAKTGNSWNTIFTQETWVTFPGVGTILTEGTTEQRKYEVIATTTLTTPAGSAPAIVLQTVEFITQGLGQVDIALERMSFITRSGLAVTVAWNINKETRERISLNDIAYFVPDGLSSVDAMAGDNKASDITFAGNWPNPFTTTTSIPFNLKRAGHVRVAVYNMAGQNVATLLNEQLSAGNHVVEFSGNNLPSGRYTCRIETEGSVVSEQMVLGR